MDVFTLIIHHHHFEQRVQSCVTLICRKHPILVEESDLIEKPPPRKEGFSSVWPLIRLMNENYFSHLSVQSECQNPEFSKGNQGPHLSIIKEPLSGKLPGLTILLQLCQDFV